LADIAGCAVDLLDIRAASTVMQCQILTLGTAWWRKDVRAGLFEAAMLSETWATTSSAGKVWACRKVPRLSEGAVSL
jgi:uncharacterized protein